MLVLSRHPGQQVVLKTSSGEVISLMVIAVEANNKVRIGFDAPKSIEIHRLEVFEQKFGPLSVHMLRQKAKANVTEISRQD